MLSKRQTQAFLLHDKIAGSFLYPLPVFWNATYTNLLVNNSPKRWASLIFWITVDLLVALACVYDVVGYFSFRREKHDMDLGIAAMLATAAIGLLIAFLFAVIFFQNACAIEGFNKLLVFKKQLFDELYQREDDSGIFDAILFIIVLTGVLCPTVIFFSALTFNFDPTLFVLEDILGDPTHRSTSTILVAFVVRVIFEASAFECGRVIGSTLLIVFVGLERLQKCLNLLLSNSLSCKGIMKHYRRLHLIYGLMKGMVLNYLSFGITLTFWLLVTTHWLMIRTSGKIPSFMYGLLVFLGFSLCIIIFQLFEVISKVGQICEAVVAKCKMEALQEHGRSCANRDFWSRRRTLLQKCESNALRKLQISYAPFYDINKAFTVRILQNEIVRLFDALLVFQID